MRDVTRRSVLAAAGTAGLVLTTAGIARADGGGPGAAPAGTEPTPVGPGKGRVQLTLPAATGPWRTGTASLHLIDRSRRDPWTSPASPRELMISLWYPTSDTHGCRRAPWLSPAATGMYRRQAGHDLNTSLDNVDFPVTGAWQGAP